MRTSSVKLSWLAWLCAAGAACSGSSSTPVTLSDASTEAGSTGSVLPALPGYAVSVFATGGAMFKGPDSLELDGTHVWVGYQMGVKSKDGTDAGGPLNSKVVEYNLDGSLAGKSFDIPGHCDGVRVDPVTHIVWATSNEDGNAVIESYDPSNATLKTYTFAAPVHGGGLDDMATKATGELLIADASANTIYAVKATFTPGTVYTEAPDDSGIVGFVGTLDLTTGGVTPVIIGLKKATGLLFVPQ